ncbi:MAG: sulfatase/phosphatase domain-containing protein, partial [Planctomycetota bacterium]
GVDVPADMQGRSLVSLFKGQTPDDWRKVFYYHYYENPGAHNVARHYGVTDGRYKLIRFYALEGQPLDDWELFDLKKDPNELRSVYGSTDYQSIQSKLQQQLTAAQEEFGVPEDTDLGSPRRPTRRNTAKPKSK